VTATPGGGLARAPKESTTVTIDGSELADVQRQLTAILVQGATLTQTVTSLREAIDRQDAGRADHEARLRALEGRREIDHAGEIAGLRTEVAGQQTEIAGLRTEVSGLQRIRWMATGAAFVLGGGGGALATELLT
jgi:hypothetical protein